MIQLPIYIFILIIGGLIAGGVIIYLLARQIRTLNIKKARLEDFERDRIEKNLKVIEIYQKGKFIEIKTGYEMTLDDCFLVDEGGSNITLYKFDDGYTISKEKL